ncbi:phosphatidylserine lipase ABHD16A-like [Sphaerodactylus townsendi]|uniref:phosphatidylserine lipase ABHD16A-like n=1 Tax=Sphaerodactylus townsendi TaxID=933632 RepID=UPI0020265324|nr:phosphatidylserine lipase ABHD16A-like [Sphaerodactylus townsendi]
MAKLLSCILGPRLYRVYRDRGSNGSRRSRPEAIASSPGALEPSWDSYYQPRTLEKHADSILALASVLWSISYYSSPFAAFYLYRKVGFEPLFVLWLSKNLVLAFFSLPGGILFDVFLTGYLPRVQCFREAEVFFP